MPVTHRTTITIICKQCQKPFSVIPSRSCRKGQPRIFCSNGCCTKSLSIPLATRFQWYLSKPTETGCILWTGALSTSGYGRIGAPPGRTPKILQAHRVAWELTHGPIHEGLDVLHDCPGGDNPGCVVVAHLRLGTHQDNMTDKVIKLQQPSGEECNLHKLTEDEVRLIRKMFATGNYYMRELVAEFHTTIGNIHAIITRKTWKHLD